MRTKRSRRAALSLVGVTVAASLGVGPNASAQEAPSVSLNAGRTEIAFGRTVALYGRISPAASGETVNIVRDDGTVVASPRTDEDGRYRVSIEPRRNLVVRAQWLAAFSDPLRLRVRPVLEVSLRAVRLFGRARLRGMLRPAHDGERVRVALRRNGNVIERRAVRLRKGLWFSSRFNIRRPGTYAAVVRFDDADHAPAVKRTGSRSTPLPSLNRGSRSVYVKLLEGRLRSLGYYLPRADRAYDRKTFDAMIAFNKVQGRPRVGYVTESSWRALVDPRRPHARSRGGGFHIEINQSKQVVYTVRDGRVRKVLHTSTGAGGATRDGSYRVFRKVAGYSGGRLYYPSYFDGLRAIHGWPEVPTYPASHGCARVPMWAAKWIYGKARLGTRVLVYH
jgi:N-acetylmuramoyl-L-alanine amidase